MRIELHLEARGEFREAVLWYDEQRLGLGEEFVGAVDSALARISLTPKSFPKWPEVSAERPPIYRAIVERFPYAIAFEVHSDRVLVLAAAHTKRRPFYWLRRASSMGLP